MTPNPDGSSPARSSTGFADIPGIAVGHWTNLDAATGCTVVLCPEGAIAGVDIRGGAPGSRETALLDPTRSVDRAHAVLLTGGSAYGLDAAGGVMRWLEERGHGYAVPGGVVPIVPAAVVFDLPIGDHSVRPDMAAGYAACEAAGGEFVRRARPGRTPDSDDHAPLQEGTVGAGTGCTVGNYRGLTGCMKGGLGTAVINLAGGISVGALAVVNAFGDVVDPATGQILAGALSDEGEFVDTAIRLRGDLTGTRFALQNTTLAVVATDARLTAGGVTKVAQMAQSGLSRTIRPAHTTVDGDAIFALSTATGEEGPPADATPVGSAAADAVALAVLRGIRAATGLAGIPAAQD